MALGHSLLAFDSCLRGLGKLEINQQKISQDLDSAWEVLAEPIQTVMRRYGLPKPYERLKALTRGQGMNEKTIRSFIATLDLPKKAKNGLLALTPSGYIGLADRLARDELKHK